MEPQSNLFPDEVQLDEVAKSHLRSMASWTLLIVIVACIGYALNIIDAILVPSYEIGSRQEGFAMSVVMGQKGLTSVIITVVIGIIIHYFLYRFSLLAARAVRTADQDSLAPAFRNLKIYFAICSILGILVVLIILIVGLSIL